MSKKNELMEKWNDLLESQEGLPDIATKSKKQLVAAILETQEKDADTDPVYRDEKSLNPSAVSWRKQRSRVITVTTQPTLPLVNPAVQSPTSALL